MQAPPPSGWTPQHGALGPMALHSALVEQGVAQVGVPVPSTAQMAGAVHPQEVPHGSGQHAPSMQASPALQQVEPQPMVQAHA
jgi:hypothetical protein